MFTVHDKPATGVQAELHYINWCLALENEHNPVPRTSLAASADFQAGAWRGNDSAAARLALAGIVKGTK